MEIESATAPPSVAIRKVVYPSVPAGLILGPDDAVLLHRPHDLLGDVLLTDLELRAVFSKYEQTPNRGMVPGHVLRGALQAEFDSFGLDNLEGEVLRVLSACEPRLPWKSHFDRDVSYDEFAILALSLSRR